jgi:hypothetical protein
MLTTVLLDGKLSGPWVDEARAVITALKSTDTVCLNLEHLSFADDTGIDLLRKFRREGIRLTGASPLIEGLLGAREPLSSSESGAGT